LLRLEVIESLAAVEGSWRSSRRAEAIHLV